MLSLLLPTSKNTNEAPSSNCNRAPSMTTNLAFENKQSDNETINLLTRNDQNAPTTTTTRVSAKMTTEKLERLKAKRDELDKKIRVVAAARSVASREKDTRRKIIIGGWVLKHRPQLVLEVIANGLSRGQDTAAFADWTSTEQGKKTTISDAAPQLLGKLSHEVA